MSQEIIPINLWADHFMLKAAGGVNCYLVKAGEGFVLIDTGMHSRRAALVQALEQAGVKPGTLSLIVITHADLDHTGNCAFLRAKYGAQVAAHPGEVAALVSGNMSLNRKKRRAWLARMFMAVFGLFNRADHITPDLTLADGDDLSAYGLAAQALHLPGHSQGSLGVLTAAGDLFCGDLLLNVTHPVLQPDFIDDPHELSASLQRLKGYIIEMVYPGHGKPFRMEELGKEV
jgi:hydroxyacylglutathione hydrolase